MRFLLALCLSLCGCWMANSQEQLIVPLGLITQPNKLGQYPAGAMSQAQGLVMRSPGLLTRVPLLVSYNANPFITSSPTTPHLLGASDADFFHVSRRNADSHWELTFYDGVSKFGNDLNAAGVPYQPITFDTSGRINWTRVRDRLLFNSDDGILIVDTANPTTNAQALPRMAGLPAPWLSVGSTATNGGALEAGFHTSCQAIIRRKFSDGYEILSPPSAASESAGQGLCNLVHAVRWQTVAQLVAGDIIEVYRTRQQADGTSVGATYYRSVTHVITAGEIAAGVATFLDQTPDTTLGLELYTNPGATTALSAKYAPPGATCMTTFNGYTFYGNRTDVAQYAGAAPGGIGVFVGTGYTRQVMVGRRNLGATFTNTSNVLTAISAADIVGLAIGQVITDAALVTGSAVITAVGAATVTLTQNANATVTKTTFSVDVIELDGVAYQAPTFNTVNTLGLTPFIANVAASPANDFQIEAGDMVAYASLPFYAAPVEFAIRRARYGGGSFTIRASNGQNYVPALPTMSETAQTISPTVIPNGSAWSERGQPEAVPPLNRAPIGSGTIQGVTSTRDAVWWFASDGLWRTTGTGGEAGRGFDWRTDLVDSTLSLSGPHAFCVLRDTVYAYTNRGLVAINGDGIDDTLSSTRVGDLLPGPPFSLTTSIQMTANETDDEVWLGIVTGGNMTYYVYHTLQNVWTTSLGQQNLQTDVIPCYARFLQGMGSIDTQSAYTQSPTLFGVCTADYQPIATDNPFAMKQWIDMVVVASAADAGKSVVPRFNGAAYTARNLVSQDRDARVSYGVPRNVPAVANSLSPGFSMAGSGSLSFYGVSLRSVMLTDQRKQR